MKNITKSITEKRNIGRKLLEAALDLLYPRRCPICERIPGKGEGGICSCCRAKLPYIREPICKKCGKQLGREAQEYCRDCGNGKHLFVEGRSVFLYEKEFRRSVHRMKFQNHREYLDFYAMAMADSAAKYLRRWKIAVIVPVPMNRKKRRERGFDQSILLAKKLSSLTGIPIEKDFLVRERYTSPQKELSAEERRENLRGAFVLTRPGGLQGSVLLVDDIYTTGATVDEICRTFHKRGIRDIYFLALCAGRNR